MPPKKSSSKTQEVTSYTRTVNGKQVTVKGYKKAPSKGGGGGGGGAGGFNVIGGKKSRKEKMVPYNVQGGASMGLDYKTPAATHIHDKKGKK